VEDVMKRKKIIIILSMAALILLPSIALSQEGAEGEDRALRLPIGDPKLKDKVVEVGAGEIVSARTGKPLSPDDRRDERQPLHLYRRKP
jgi:hypothetical protein